MTKEKVHEEAWISFVDEYGAGVAQPDFFVVFPTHVLLLECKLSQKSAAFVQMGGLYAPLLRKLFGLPVIGVQVCRNISFIPEKYWLENLEVMFNYPGFEEMYTWHAFNI